MATKLSVTDVWLGCCFFKHLFLVALQALPWKVVDKIRFDADDAPDRKVDRDKFKNIFVLPEQTEN